MNGMYAGTFDPLTVGHVDLVERAARMFDTLFLAVGTKDSKTPLFTMPERFEMAVEILRPIGNVTVVTFDGLLVDAVRKFEAQAIVRGLRTYSDFESEFQMALTNRDLAPSIETVFLIPKHENSYVSSSTVKEVWRHGGDISNYVHPLVLERMAQKK